MKRGGSPSHESSMKKKKEEIAKATDDLERAGILRIETEELEKKIAQSENQKDSLSCRIHELESMVEQARSATTFAPYKGERQRASFLARHETQISKFRKKLSTTDESCNQLKQELCMKRDELLRIDHVDKI